MRHFIQNRRKQKVSKKKIVYGCTYPTMMDCIYTNELMRGEVFEPFVVFRENEGVKEFKRVVIDGVFGL